MNSDQKFWYLQAVNHELEKLDEKEFIGNIDFKFNINRGSIANMNIVLQKSIKKTEER